MIRVIPDGAIKLPVKVEDITASWLTEALSSNYAGVEVVSLDAEVPVWGTGTKIRVRLQYNQAGIDQGLPASLIVKGGFAEHRELMEDVYIKEVRFYRDLRPKLDINVPACFFAAHDSSVHQHIVILEDLNLRNVDFCRVQKSLTFDQAQQFLDGQARYHARWWNAPALADGELDWLQLWDPLPATADGDYARSRLEPDTWASITELPRAVGLPRQFLDLDWMERALAKLSAFSREAQDCCFLHADHHLGNLYFDADGTAGVLDWQSPTKGHWSHDVTYFIVSALDIADRKKWDKALLSYYLERLKCYGVKEPPSFEAAWEAYRLQIIDGLFYWLVNPEEFQAELNNCAVAPRFAMAALDVDTPALIE